MAIHKLNKTRTTTWEITKSGDTWVLGENGRIEDPADNTLVYGIDAYVPGGTVDNTTINVLGTIQLDALAAAGVYVVGANNAVTIGEKGHLQVLYGIGVFGSNLSGTLKIANAGLIAANYGIFADSVQDSATITNDGTIRATEVGIYSEGAGTHIANSGVIKASLGIAINPDGSDANHLLAENASHIVNTGKITGTEYAIWASDVAVNIRNKGTLNGDVELYTGDDVINTKGGTINGDVFLGAGNDVFKGAGGTLNGVLYGGMGNDVVTLSSPGTVFIEYAGEGFDTVRINSTYMLGENIEHLTLLGKANHTGIGNGLSNTLTGNKGANTLYGMDGFDALDGGRGNDRLFGGDGGDIFVFKPGYGRDTIMDFDDGVDLIAISNTGLADYNALSAKISQHGEDVWIRLSDTDLLVIRDTLATDIDASDFWAIN